jgi:hypothetical protein
MTASNTMTKTRRSSGSDRLLFREASSHGCKSDEFAPAFTVAPQIIECRVLEFVLDRMKF